MQYGHGRDLEILLVSSNSPVQHFQSEISFYKPYHYDMPLRVHSSPFPQKLLRSATFPALLQKAANCPPSSQFVHSNPPWNPGTQMPDHLDYQQIRCYNCKFSSMVKYQNHWKRFFKKLVTKAHLQRFQSINLEQGLGVQTVTTHQLILTARLSTTDVITYE